MALTKKMQYQGLDAAAAYIRAEIFARQGPATPEGKPFQSVVKVYASQDQANGPGGAFADFNCPFTQAPGQSIEAAAYAAIKQREDMKDAQDC